MALSCVARPEHPADPPLHRACIHYYCRISTCIAGLDNAWVIQALWGGGAYDRGIWEQSVVQQKRSRMTVWRSPLLLRCRAMRCWCGMSEASAMAAKLLFSDTCRRMQLDCVLLAT